MMFFMLSVMTVQAQGLGCYTDLDQDLNCNGIDVADERAVNTDDPLCNVNRPDPGPGGEPTEPYESSDYYYDYHVFDCQLFMLADNNGDGLPDVVVTDPARYRTADGAPPPGWVAARAIASCTTSRATGVGPRRARRARSAARGESGEGGG